MRRAIILIAAILSVGLGLAQARKRPIRKQLEAPAQLNPAQLNPAQLNIDNRAIPDFRNKRGGLNLVEQRFGGLAVPAQAAGPAIHAPYEGPISARKIQQAVDDAMLFLRQRQAPDGSIGEQSYAKGGATALATLAMLAAGADPIADPTVKRALAWLAAQQPDNTYVRAIRANVWEYALRKVDDEPVWRAGLEADFAWLLEALNENGWRYGINSTDWDNSCTQYGVLGIWAGMRAGLKPPEGFWPQMSRHFQKTQNADGGWGYVQGSSSSANMATAGLASMFLVFDSFHGKARFRRDNPKGFSDGQAGEVLAALDRGMTWLGTHEGDRLNAYYLYGIERAGVASGRKYIGGVDWFAEGAEGVLGRQVGDGSIPLGYTPEIGTALSTLFLVYGGAPVAFAKLEHGAGDDWNRNPRDLANLARWLWSAWP